MNLVDVFCIVLCAIILFDSYRRGFIKSIFDLIAYIIGVPSGIYVASNYSSVIYDKYVESKLTSYVEERLVSSANADNLISSIKEILGNLPDFSKDLTKFNEFSTHKIAVYFTNGVLEPIVTVLLKILLFAAVILAIRIICSIISSLLGGIVKTGVGKKVNSVFGITFGIAKCFVFLLFVSTLTFYILKIPFDSDNNVINYLKESVLIDFINQHNPIIDLI